MTERATSSLFRSPWQEGGFVRLVGVVRTLLRLWPRLENRFIDRLVSDQNRRVHAYLRGRTPQTLLLIKDYKTIFNNKIRSISEKINLRRNYKHQTTEEFEAQAMEFYDGLIDKIQNINQEPEAKSKRRSIQSL